MGAPDEAAFVESVGSGETGRILQRGSPRKMLGLFRSVPGSRPRAEGLTMSRVTR